MAAAAIAAVALEKTLKKLFPLYWKESYRQSSSAAAAAAAVLSKTSSQLHLVALTRSLSIFPALFPFCYQSFFCLFQGQSFFYLTFRVLFVHFEIPPPLLLNSLIVLLAFSAASPGPLLVSSGRKFVRAMIALSASSLPSSPSPSSALPASSPSVPSPLPLPLLLSCIFAAARLCEMGRGGTLSAAHVIISHVDLCCSAMEVMNACVSADV
jgi:hypothetical protein